MQDGNKTQSAISRTQAKARIEHFCAYQERAQQETRDKLYSYGLHQQEVENIICELIQDNFLNEERFAVSYAGGKFRMKHWGRRKIYLGLKAKRVPEKLIGKALLSLDEDEYMACLSSLLEKKNATLIEKDIFKRQAKLIYYAESKGYKKDEILNSLKLNRLNDL